jgi:hypothetical protein
MACACLKKAVCVAVDVEAARTRVCSRRRPRAQELVQVRKTAGGTETSFHRRRRVVRYTPIACRGRCSGSPCVRPGSR